MIDSTPDLGSISANRSAVAGAGATSQRPGAGPSDGDPSASRIWARTSLINTARGLTTSYGERLRGCSPRNLNAEKAQQLSPELQAALEPLLGAIYRQLPGFGLAKAITEYAFPFEITNLMSTVVSTSTVVWLRR